MKRRAALAVLLVVTALASRVFADPSGRAIVAEAAPTHAALALAQMQTAAHHAQLVLKWAREKGTRAQVACADERLSRADVALRTARDHAHALDDAWARGDAGAVQRELLWIGACEEAARVASRASDACFDAGEATSVRVVAAPVADARR